MFGIPIAVVTAIVGIIAGLFAREAVKLYQALVKFAKSKGVDLPDNPEVEHGIEAAVKALVPVLVSEAEKGKVDPAELADALKKALGG